MSNRRTFTVVVTSDLIESAGDCQRCLEIGLAALEMAMRDQREPLIAQSIPKIAQTPDYVLDLPGLTRVVQEAQQELQTMRSEDAKTLRGVIQSQETTLRSQEGTIASLADEIKKMRDEQKSDTKSSAKIGAEAELSIEESLCRMLPSLDIRPKETTKAGDFTIVHAGKRIMIEVKKYSRTVGASQLTKFRSDLDDPSNAFDAAIFVAVDCGIVGQTRKCVLAGGDRPAIYLCQVAADSPIIGIAVEFLLSLLCDGKTTEVTSDALALLLRGKVTEFRALNDIEKKLKNVITYNKRELEGIKDSIGTLSATIGDILETIGVKL